MSIERGEYEARQRGARALAERRGFGALLAWSRGGATQDHYADVYYLAGFYPHQPFVPDKPGSWRAQGHAALLLPVAGPSTLLVDVGALQDPPPVADTIRRVGDPIAALADVLRRDVPSSGGVAVLGGEGLAWRWGRALLDLVPGHALVEADDLAVALRTRKSPAELALLRAAGQLGARALAAALEAAVPGATEAEVAAAAIATIVRAGGVLYGLGLSSGPTSHTFAPSGPAAYTRRRLEPGDLVRLDLYGSIEGYLFDLGRSRVVGRRPTATQGELLDAVRDAVRAGLALVRPGMPLAMVARRCEETLTASAYVRRHGRPGETMGAAWGHGLGLAFEPPWIEPSAGGVVESGMCLALERRIEAPGIGGANYEDDVIVTADGAEVITQLPLSDDA